jgi:hypothetical protein
MVHEEGSRKISKQMKNNKNYALQINDLYFLRGETKVE